MGSETFCEDLNSKDCKSSSDLLKWFELNSRDCVKGCCCSSCWHLIWVFCSQKIFGGMCPDSDHHSHGKKTCPHFWKCPGGSYFWFLFLFIAERPSIQTTGWFPFIAVLESLNDSTVMVHGMVIYHFKKQHQERSYLWRKPIILVLCGTILL